MKLAANLLLLLVAAGVFPMTRVSAKPGSKGHTKDTLRPSVNPPKQEASAPDEKTVEIKASPGKIEKVSKTSNVTTKRYIDARYLNKEFAARKTSVLKGKGQMIIDAALAENIDPVFLAAAICFESGWGTSRKIRVMKNPGGLTGGGAYRTFNSVEEGVREMAKSIREKYVDNKNNSIAGIASIYAPVGAKNDPGGTNYKWPGDVASIMNKLIRESSKIQNVKAK